MRSYTLPMRYFLLLLSIIGVMIGMVVVAEILESENIAPDVKIIIKSPFANSIFEQIFATLLVAVLILILYSIGVYAIVRKLPDEASRFTAVRIFSAILVGLGLLLGLMVWVEDPKEIVLVIGIIWGAIVVALRDLIQNMVGSLVLLVTRLYRIGDRIHVKGVYGTVMDVGFFRTTLMKLDEESGDHATGQIVTVPNGILFRETITNTSRELSFMGDEIRITLPFSADIQRIRALLVDIVHRHTVEIQGKAAREIEQLGDRKFMPEIGTEPSVFVHIDKHQILMVVKYYTESSRRAEIKNSIVEDISRAVPGILEVER
ncbi:MAG: mechanosensitive channel MscS [Methanoregulaceae archaeon PtaU1.Bin222]|nr:MAG: mechanosensitive channel MscS [Methanoregulaceae archaeon PtaU1.Bin222]